MFLLYPFVKSSLLYRVIIIGWLCSLTYLSGKAQGRLTVSVSNTLSCSQKNATITALSSCTGGVFYSFSGPNNFFTWNTTGVTSVTADGTYTVTATNWERNCTDTVTTAVASAFHPDYLPLMSLYYATNGAGWKLKRGWATNCEPCSGWTGISCSNNRVTGIELANVDYTYDGNNLVGSLPESIGQLTKLTTLNLSYNRGLSGPIPTSIGKLTDLEYIQLVDNERLSGTLPESLGNLTKLSFLQLRGTKISGSLPAELGNCTALTQIYVQQSQLTGSIPESFGKLKNMIVLYLNDNQLSGPIPSSVSSFTALTQLVLSNNKLTGSIPASLTSLQNIKLLNLSQNALTGPIPSSLGRLSKLENLVLYGNQLTGTLPGSLGQLAALYVLNLNTNQLTGSIPESYTALTRLSTFDVEKNQLSGQLPTTIGRMTNLFDVRLANNQFSGALPASIGDLPRLNIFTINDNQFSGSIPSTIGNLRNLYNFIIANNQLTGSLPESINYLSNLQSFLAANNRFIGEIPAFTDSRYLRYVDVSNNQFSGSLPGDIANRVQLQSFSAQSNQLSGCIPRSFATLCGRTITISNNAGLPGNGDWAAFCSNQTGICPPCDLLITQQPFTMQYACNRGVVQLKVSAACSLPVSYQWYNEAGPLTNSVRISGATSPTLTIWDARPSDIVSYRVFLSAACGSAYSTRATFSLEASSYPEFDALADFFYATDGPNWTNKSGWLTTCSPYSGWFGLTTSPLTGQVTSLNLSPPSAPMAGNNLRGTLPASLSVLSGLEQLLINNNPQLVGGLPTSIGALTSLTLLDASANGLTGPIPASVGSLTKLTSLSLGFNQLSGRIPSGLGNLSALQRLNVASNKLTGCLPVSLTNLCGKTVDISGNVGLANGGDWLAFCTNRTGADNGIINSLKPGQWYDQSVWSCGNIPTSTDTVLLRHSVVVGVGQIAEAQRIWYTNAGKLLLGTGVQVKVGR
ncbi:leucine-rich repeat domain-containing protein [Fibrella aquatilis]|uniref:Disease resistance R13L4/SHOC-2-like LRR domain-containing protein n=1 Tax=Fibrella aquatilis TaxID=2817059 RepID=A0A939G7G7_9BACT|nr:hypothetical protein [Fibrella aquatilis]MBO0931562.1 hypothetical protein [Fibrella aquatilis]